MKGQAGELTQFGKVIIFSLVAGICFGVIIGGIFIIGQITERTELYEDITEQLSEEDLCANSDYMKRDCKSCIKSCTRLDMKFARYQTKSSGFSATYHECHCWNGEEIVIL